MVHTSRLSCLSPVFHFDIVTAMKAEFVRISIITTLGAEMELWKVQNIYVPLQVFTVGVARMMDFRILHRTGHCVPKFRLNVLLPSSGDFIILI